MAYSDFEKAETLIKLAVNKGNYDRTANDTGISRRTIIRWAKTSPKKGVPELLERAIERLLMTIPEKWEGNDWSIALGILLDKWLLMHGKANQRIENLFGALQGLPEEQLDELERQFTEAASRFDAH
jgi:hypothetical protein